jgi:phosphatidylglycerol:prolipoprotein diacylglycerol transferase
MIPYIPEPAIRVGSRSLSPFAITAVAAVLTSLWGILRRSHKLGVSVEEMFRLWFFMYIGAMVGAHLYKVLVDDNAHSTLDFATLLRYHGLSSAGAFSGGLCAGLIWCGYKRLSAIEILRRVDIAAFVIPLAFMIGRLGCALTHDHIGRASSSWLAVDFPTGPSFDLGLIEFLFLAGVAILFYLLDLRPRPAGFYLGSFGILYGAFRLWLNALRTEPEYVYGMASVVTGICICVVIGLRSQPSRDGKASRASVTSHRP